MAAPNHRRGRRPLLGPLACRMLRDAIDGGQATARELADAFRIPEPTVRRLAQRARDAEGHHEAHTPLTGHERGYLARCYGRSSNAAVKAFLMQLTHRPGR